MDSAGILEILMAEENFTIEEAAILMSLTKTREKEDELKAIYAKRGLTSVATTVSGDDSVVRKKIVASVVGACLNANLISKNKKNIHAVVHATHEACMGGKLGVVVNQNYQLKVVIVRNEDWLCVCLYGNLAIHEFSNHKTIGIGIMHI